MTEPSPSTSSPVAVSWPRLVVPGLLGAAVLWSFWPTLGELANRWSETEYSHGYLVPAFAAALLWLRRDQAAALAPRFCWWGVLLLSLGVLLRFAGEYLYLDWLDAGALLPCLAGLAVLLGGKPALRWAWPAIAFLVFMIPLPFRVEIALALPLQRVATLVSTYALQTLGLAALSEGNVILMGDTRLGVEQACSGLSMLMIFFALAMAFSIVVQRPLWQKIVLVLSAVPIALIANITRITVTGLLHETVSHRLADMVFHDLAGWLMMPFALVLLWLEIQALARLFVEVAPKSPVPLVSPVAASQPAAGKGKHRRHHKQPMIPPVPHGSRRR